MRSTPQPLPPHEHTFMYALNSFEWILSNILVAYIAFALIVFVIGYYTLFDPKATTAGRFIFRFAISLIGVIALVFIGVFVDPVSQYWWQFPPDVLWWRPIVRLAGYGYVAYAITSLAVLLVVRKWYPEKLRTALDRQIVKTRKEETIERRQHDGNTSS